MSEWTIDTLREYLLRTIQDAENRSQDSIGALKEVVTAALKAAETAVLKAETAADKRFEGVNEFRSTLGDQQRNLMPRAEAEVMMKALDQKIDTVMLAVVELRTQMAEKRSERSGERTGGADTWKLIAGILAMVATVLAIRGQIVP